MKKVNYFSNKKFVNNFNSEVSDNMNWNRTLFFKRIQFLIDVSDKEIDKIELF